MALNIMVIGNLVKSQDMEDYFIKVYFNLKEILLVGWSMDLVNKLSKMVIITKDNI
jgi:hypothetical protein